MNGGAPPPGFWSSSRSLTEIMTEINDRDGGDMTESLEDLSKDARQAIGRLRRYGTDDAR